ncbi:ubiquitin carboxyl-terminal hydrolase 44 [Phyllopteryx taeniolatus]|uniref:ubiquitin carboxyl-terminal hydrolase 44 n=1 Tax=Phyllopteryx taeniolatus TaxID=161469 RepID=UPI002AD4F7CB|nr:ubiquitin carboxyl-terminal hydrolase 44 [Phyllopteryx taeniolatus]XP_061617317.1 ubiquitin carboxyl-terminal hydrolase 44 [Phyllopteryx taeniolatus]XP_061617318.1 ubiquitin carboxyl-terminal hydrolase 44 [Phyllopteryx taeniolatus]XP_061617319.1 ubiquitin carboxyl-terminal hydrolase 44 [Phyllopteryx taeniolatus]
MDRCKHVGRLRLAPDHSILNPQKWHCVDCNTSESIWACLGCAHVACGRYIEEHALQHFKQQRHPLAMEVNELYVFCYLCDDYVLNDNATGDLKLLRSTLSAIQSQRYEVTTRSGRTLRSATDAPTPCGASELQLRDEDRMFTALWHRRRALMGRVFRLWFGLTERGRARQEEERRREQEEDQKREARERRRALKRQLHEQLENAPQRKSRRLRQRTRRTPDGVVKTPQKTNTSAPLLARRSRTPATPAPKRSARVKKTDSKPKSKSGSSSGGKSKRKPLPAPSRQTASRRKQATEDGGSPFKRRPTVTPGVTGLRNLGNTCYMNSILQVLSHLHVFRECFLRLDLTQALELLASAVHGQLAAEPSPLSPHRKGIPAGAGLSGGASRGRNMELIQPKEPSSKHISLCHELHTLFQVMWSGKWALVSPFAMLHSVWQLIPAFRGYAQQDAQEFLCELLDKVQRELESTGARAPSAADVPHTQKRLIKQVLSVVNTIFHGQLLSQVTCVACDHRSNTVEPFWDLSLEFPERYHSNSSRESATQASCHLTEMLAKFTETEALEGNIYACDQCNSTRRRSLSKAVLLTEAQKQLTVHKLPQVLRLHLKRFRWSGRNHREKIGVHVRFDQLLNMEPYCRGGEPSAAPTSPRTKLFLYDLSAVVMHHGKGFGSGHYTAYCYNSAGGFWVHCNDSKMNVCSVDEVCRAQAYILFYTQRVTQDKDRPL